jgi:hypothetical protein
MGLRPTHGLEKHILSTALYGSVALPFVIPERSRISCDAEQDRAACAPFRKERPMKFLEATKFYRKSGAAEGSEVPRTIPGNIFDRAVERPAVCRPLAGPKTFVNLPRFLLQ